MMQTPGGTVISQRRYVQRRIMALPSCKFGVTQADFTSDDTISVKPSDAKGNVATGAVALDVYIMPNQSSVNITQAEINGETVTGLSCKIPAGTLLQYAIGADGEPYLVGLPPTVVEFMRYDPSSTKFQLRVRWLFGSNVSTLSDWIDLAESAESAIQAC